MEKPLIVGAGPTGLTAALFLARMGVVCRIVDRALQPAPTSKALGVNPRTLRILEETGLSKRIKAEGLVMSDLEAHDHGRIVARVRLDFRELGVDHPMVILPQARTEALLTEALLAHGIEVERGVALARLEQTDETVTVTLARLDGRQDTLNAPFVLGADGAHSAVRHALGIDFPGVGMPEDWRLMDVDLDGPEPGVAWANFTKDGPFVALPFNATTWRLIGFGPPLLERLPPGWRAGTVHWESGFHVSHRVAERFCVGRVCLAGDAAHIHSPIGARGMNLGIEDAYVFAHCAKAFLDGAAGKLEAYGAERHAVDKAVVARVERLTNAVRARGGAGRLVRRLALPVLSRLPPIRNIILRQGFGLDHPLTIP